MRKGRAAYQWFLADALTQVVVTPALLYWFTRESGRQRRHIGESIVVYVCLVIALFVGLVVNHPSIGDGKFAHAGRNRFEDRGRRGHGSIRRAVAGSSRAVDPTVLSLAIVTAEREWLRIREADLSSKLIDAQDSERGRIASELHDNVGQQLALLLLGMEQLKRDAPMSESGQRQLKKLAETAKRVASDIRDLSHKLHPRGHRLL